MGFNRFSLLPCIRGSLLCLCFFFLSSAHLAIAQDGQLPDEAGGEADKQVAIDEITVVAPRSLIAIKRQMARADEVLFDISNALIDDPLYQVHCRHETSAGSNIRRRVCKPGFERELLAEAWEDERTMQRMGESSISLNYELPEAELREHRTKQKQIMVELAAESPELTEAILTRARLQRDYNDERRRRQQKDD